MKVPLKSYWELLSRHIQPQRKRFALLVMLLLVSISLQIINPQIMRAFIDTALGNGTTQKLLTDAVAFIAIALLSRSSRSVSPTWAKAWPGRRPTPCGPNWPGTA